VALLFFLVAGWVAFHTDARLGFQQRLEGKLASTKFVEQAQRKTGGDAVGAVIGTLYTRIVIMQIAIIFGAWFAGAIGSLAPLLLVVGLKTVIDLGLGSYVPLVKDLKFPTDQQPLGR
jgi:Family of unknown function (DUF6498)